MLPAGNSKLDPLSDEYVRFARAVCSNTKHEDYPVQRIGSGVVVAYEGEFYLITARHVFSNNHASPTDVVVPLGKTGVTWWPTNACMHLDATQTFVDDNTFADLAVYSMETSQDVRSSITEYDYLPFPSQLELKPNQQLFAFGYPDLGSELDIEGRKLVATLTMVEGVYIDKTSYTGLHVFESEYLKEMNPNGMSGGPVTSMDHRRIGRHLLAGIIIQGGGSSGRFHFVDAKMLREALLFSIPRLRELRENGPFVNDQVPVGS
jgi:hypothetical protein